VIWTFALLLDALEPFVSGEAVARAIAELEGWQQRELAALLPAVGRLVGVEWASGSDERHRLARAVRALVERVAAERPLALLLDDVHWADPASADVLALLLHRPPRAGVLLGLAARARRAPALESVLAAAVQRGTGEVLELGPLPLAAVAELLPGAGPATRERLYRESGGNPFYLQELFRAGRSEPGGVGPGLLAGVPGAVQAALAGEVAALSREGRRVLEGAAVAGDPFEPALAAVAAEVLEVPVRNGEAPLDGAVLDHAEALAERLFGAALGALELFSVYLGAELGLYRTLADQGPLALGELAARAGIAERYAREWLEQQAVAGLLHVDDPDAPADARRYALPAEHARVLADPDDPAHVAPFAHMLAGIGAVLPQVAEAYRTGAGVPYGAYGQAFRHGQGQINRPAFIHELAADWLAAMPDVVARLESARHARVADVGCGQGFSTLAIAGAFLGAHVDGLDLDPGSIADARRHAAEARLDGPRALHRGRRRRSGRARPLRPRRDPRGAPRHGAARRGAHRRTRRARRRRHAAGGRRARGGFVHRPATRSNA
jgi:hypothetical protein